MEQQETSSLSRFLKLDYNNDDHIWLQSSYSLRKLIGILGMLLPLLLIISMFIYGSSEQPLESISHYYFTRAGTIFTAILSLIAIFLIIYSGKKPIDFYVSCLAGFFALCVVLFPTDNLLEECSDFCGKNAFAHIHSISEVRVIFHYISAAIFLGCLAYMSINLFTKSNKLVKERGREKKIRNRIYRVCGALIIAALAVMGLYGLENLLELGIIDKDMYEANNMTFWMETVAVESFGFAWLIKGETLFRDKVN